MIGFIIGIAAGFGIGAIVMALASAASEADDDLDKLYDRFGGDEKPNNENERPVFIVTLR